MSPVFSASVQRHAFSWRPGRRADPVQCGAKPKVMLVVNSCVTYNRPLVHLMESLEAAWFPLDNLVVVIGGCKESAEPQRESVTQWLPGCGRSVNVTVIRTVLQNFDYHGFDALHTYRQHPLIVAESYMYLLDTSTAQPHFSACFAALRVRWNELLISPAPASNVCAFGHGVLDRFGDNFRTPVSKADAIAVEHDESTAPLRSVASFADHVRFADARVFRGTRDIYGTGKRRWVYEYPTFGVCKYIHMRLEQASKHELSDVCQISTHERAVAATGVGRLVSLEKLGYAWDQTSDLVRVTFSLPPGAEDCRLDSCTFSERGCKLRLVAGGKSWFFDVAAFWAHIDAASSRLVLSQRDRRRAVLKLAKHECGQDWPQLRGGRGAF